MQPLQAMVVNLAETLYFKLHFRIESRASPPVELGGGQWPGVAESLWG